VNKIITGLCLFFSFSLSAAQYYAYDGVISKTINTDMPKKVTLMKVRMSKDFMNTMKRNLNKRPILMATNTTQTSVQLGMGNIPVADQGYHGSCVVFSVTEALSALNGTPLSELCTLGLGQYIENNGFGLSGWNGQTIKNVMSRLDDFGIVYLDTQLANGCGGLNAYPGKEFKFPQDITPEEYSKISNSVESIGLDSWTNYYDINQWINKTLPGEQILNLTKNALNHQHRVVVGVLVPALYGTLGAFGQYNVNNDTWVINSQTAELIKDIDNNPQSWGGHAMIITGYDDNAVAIDEDGKEHKGLITLRNSWGADAGDNGDFYMSYDYFMHLALELVEITNIQ